MAAATFFEQQHLARRNTRVMVVLFLLSVVAVVVAVDLVLAWTWIWGYGQIKAPANWDPSVAGAFALVPTKVYVWGTFATAGIILLVSAVNVVKLGAGGTAVAEMVGARRITPAARDALERRLLNVVEEMAIASGVRVPAVYVMDDERGINAFAAGYDVSNCVITVTRGTLETLSRDELQGVIGHEFSHILNGDMRLNIRMIGVLAGIVFISSIGEFIMRSTRGSRNGKGSGSLVLVGLALFIIGYVGLFFARLIKAAVSRQREFLADASSVQFTRNPEGIAGALDQIGRGTALVSNRYAEELAHMYFGQGIKVWMGGVFDTHPPLEERIRRVCPGFQRTAYLRRREAAVTAGAVEGEAVPGVASGFAGPAVSAADGRRIGDLGMAWGRSAGESAALVGSMDAAKVDYAARLLAQLPDSVREGVRESAGASATVVALLLAPRGEVLAQQLGAMESGGLARLAAGASALAPLVQRLGPAFRLTLLDLALPAVKLGSETDQRDLLQALEIAIHADRRVSLHEFVVLSLVRHQLAQKPGIEPAGRRKIVELRSEILLVLGTLARAGIRGEASGEQDRQWLAAMRAGMQAMGLDAEPGAKREFSVESVLPAFDALKTLAPLQKAIVVKGLFAAATVDRTICVSEAELMRLVGAVLDCPLPPLLESLDPTTLAE